jgi:DNA-binding transcriptional LysR family regulator
VDRLRSMEVFIATVDAGSLTAASARFGITPVMAGKHIRFLEHRLGTALLTRTTRRQSLTEIGRRYYDSCLQVLREVERADTAADSLQAAPRGRLRVNAPLSLGSTILMRVVTEYLAACPEVDAEVSLDDRNADLVAGAYDVFVRIGKMSAADFIARELQPYEMVICAAPEYLARAGVPRTGADLARHECLGFTRWRKGGGWEGLRPAASRNVSRPSSRLQADSGAALRTAALQGFGIVMQPKVLLVEDLSAGALVPILPALVPKPRPVHVLYHRNRRRVPKVARFVELLVQRFGKETRSGR